VWRGKEVTTGIYKSSVDHPVMLRRMNLDGDAQADLSVHGGRHKAAYAYPSEHYAYWREVFPGMDLPWGMFGENFTTEGIDERTVCAGDRLRIGEAEVVVTQPRFPCYKLCMKFGRSDMSRRFRRSGRTGFYMRVEREGRVCRGDAVSVIARDPAGVSIADLVRLRARGRTDGDLLAQFLGADGTESNAAFRTLVARHGPKVLEVCRRVLVRAEDAEDAFQVTVLALATVAQLGKRNVMTGVLMGVFASLVLFFVVRGVFLLLPEALVSFATAIVLLYFSSRFLRAFRRYYFGKKSFRAKMEKMGQDVVEKDRAHLPQGATGQVPFSFVNSLPVFSITLTEGFEASLVLAAAGTFNLEWTAIGGLVSIVLLLVVASVSYDYLIRLPRWVIDLLAGSILLTFGLYFAANGVLTLLGAGS
jgi:MOSC domain-containing protein YiiM/uncharacterized membrane protein